MIYTWRWKADRSICLSIRRGDALQEQNTIVHPLAIFDSYQKTLYISLDMNLLLIYLPASLNMNVALDSAYSPQEEYWCYLDYLEAYFREIRRLYYH